MDPACGVELVGIGVMAFEGMGTGVGVVAFEAVDMAGVKADAEVPNHKYYTCLLFLCLVPVRALS